MVLICILKLIFTCCTGERFTTW